MQWDVAPRALDAWSPTLVAAADAGGGDTTPSISIYDEIGMDPWTGEGVTAKRIAGVLRSIGPKDIVVNVNSPGGDLFEGLAIYNLLRQHEGQVTVRVLGLAASAASVIAMAGDVIEIARAGFFMVHNTWMVVVGNRIDMREVADTLEPFDRAMADIYAARSGAKVEDMLTLMDGETWIGGQSAVDQGFADALLPADAVKEKAITTERVAAHVVDLALAKAGMRRSERRAMLHDLKAGGTPSATTEGGTHNAAPTPAEAPTLDAGAEVKAAFAAMSLSFDFASLHATISEVTT